MVIPCTLTFCSEGHNAFGGLLGKKCTDDWVGDTPSTATTTRAPVMLKNQSNICFPGFEPD